MKREFKFRAWDKVNKRFVKQKSVTFPFCPTRATKNGFALKTKLVLQQFIGQHDKAGSEIYEGDILLYRNRDGYRNSWTIEVFWSEDRFIARWNPLESYNSTRATRKGDLKAGAVEWSHFKKVGNIFQTPNLRP